MSVTAMILNRDEATFEKSIYSIEPYVDEIIVNDASKHNFMEVHKICSQFGNKIRLYHMNPCYKTQVNFAFSKVRTKWALRWDSDFIAMENISFLFNLIKFLKEDSYAISFGVLDPITREKHHEVYLFTKRYDLLRKRIEKTVQRIYRRIFVKIPPPRIGWHPFPIDFKTIRLNECFAFHHQGKPSWRKIEHRHQMSWSLLSQKERDETTFEDYVANREARGVRDNQSIR